MSCESIAARASITIRAYLMTETGVEAVDGDAKSKTLQIVYRPDIVEPDRARAMLKQIGYAVGE